MKVETSAQTGMPRLLRLPKVIELTGLSRDSVYRLVKAGNFPKPRKLSEMASAWLESDIREWIESRPVSNIASPNARKGAAA